MNFHSLETLFVYFLVQLILLLIIIVKAQINVHQKI